MPKVRDYIPMDMLLNELDQLDRWVQLTYDQVATLLGITTNQVKNKQATKKSIPYVREGGQSRFRVEDVRNFMKGLPSTHSARIPDNGGRHSRWNHPRRRWDD